MGWIPSWHADYDASGVTRDPFKQKALDPRILEPATLAVGGSTWENLPGRYLVEDPLTGLVGWNRKWTLGNPNRKHCEYAANVTTATMRNIGFEGTPTLSATGSGAGVLQTNYGAIGHYLSFTAGNAAGDWAGIRSSSLSTLFKWVWAPTIAVWFRLPADLTDARILIAASKEELNGTASPVGTPSAGGVSRTVALRTSNVTTPTTATSISANAHTAGYARFTRASGSWVTDGYYKGGRVTASSFSNGPTNATWTVFAVTATDLDVIDFSDVITTEGAGGQVAGVADNGNFHVVHWDGQNSTVIDTGIVPDVSDAYRFWMEVDQTVNGVKCFLYNWTTGEHYGEIANIVWGTMPNNQLFGIECLVEALAPSAGAAIDIGRIVVEHN